MTSGDHFRLLSAYNAWMNRNLYTAAGTLTGDALTMDRGAFFGSIIGTLNHLVVGDTIWLQRFSRLPAEHPELDPVRALPAPSSLNQIVFADLAPLWERRQMLDGVITDWTARLSDSDLELVLHYSNTRGTRFAKPFSALLLHFFNHQTHHRGQTTTLLNQAGVDCGVTDMLALIPHVNG